jgi:hypothetical protein
MHPALLLENLIAQLTVRTEALTYHSQNGLSSVSAIPLASSRF